MAVKTERECVTYVYGTHCVRGFFSVTALHKSTVIYLLVLVYRFNFERTKLHAALGQRLQAEEMERAEQRRREKLRQRYCPVPPPPNNVTVIATPSTD